MREFPPPHTDHGQDGALPTRLIHRLVVDMQLACSAACDAAIRAHTGVPAPLKRSAFLLLILRCHRALADPSANGTAPPARAAGGISVSAIAASFDQPFETVRRHVNALIEDGLCERRGPRITIGREVFRHPVITQLLIELHTIMSRFIAHLAAAGVALPPARERLVHNPLATVAAAIDLTLAQYEYGDRLFDSWLQLHVFAAVFAANSRMITDSDELSRRYGAGAAAPPSRLLTPVTPAEIARSLGMSVATARRQVRNGIDAGLLERRSDGVVYTPKFQDHARIANWAELSSRRAMRIVERLAASGFRFHEQPAQPHYAGLLLPFH